MQILVIPLVGEQVYKGWIAVESENNRLVGGEECIVLPLGKTVRMLRVGLEPHKVHHVDDPYLELGECRAEYGYSRQCLKGWGVSCAGHDDIGF